MSHPPSPSAPYRSRRILRLAAVVIGTSASWLAALGLLLWLIGRVISDRSLWGQFLLWIPTPVVILLAVIGLIAALRPGRDAPRKRRRRLRWSVTLAAVLIYFGFVEHRLLRLPSAARDGLHIVHWNCWPDEGESTEGFLDGVLSLDPDILILTDAWIFPWWQQSREWAQRHNAHTRFMRPFSIISKTPIIRTQHIVMKDEIIVVLIELDTRERLGRTLTLYAVDMPSNLDLVRMDLAREARRLLDAIEQPEASEPNDGSGPASGISRLSPNMVVGDFNITRGSAAMRAMFPDHRHAYRDGGYGHAATFHRAVPLYHIDHVLLDESLRATRYDIVNPGVARHRIQSVHVVNTAR
jgi:endonuclease/exonuclease/phosphatase family metal-dependent hydrolase